jgi:hypothetical protein
MPPGRPAFPLQRTPPQGFRLNLPTDIDVLIVGAGPSGLMLGTSWPGAACAG